MSERVTGYTLLFIGILIMIIALVNIFMVFTGRMKPIRVIRLDQSTSTSSFDITQLFPNLPEDQKSQLQQLGGINPTAGLFPPELMNDLVNLTTHFFLMTFLMGFGQKLASLGVNLVRPIKVTLRSQMAGVTAEEKQ